MGKKKEEPPPDEEADGEGEAGGRGGNKRMAQTQAQVDEVVDIMKMNIEKVLERDQKLGQLDDRADKLQEGANQFKSQAASLKNKFWLQNLKMMIIMAILGIILFVVIYIKMGGNPKDLNPANMIPEGEDKGEGGEAAAGDGEATEADAGGGGGGGDGKDSDSKSRRRRDTAAASGDEGGGGGEGDTADAAKPDAKTMRFRRHA